MSISRPEHMPTDMNGDGIHYELPIPGRDGMVTPIDFMHLSQNGKLVDGVTNESIILMLIDRLQKLSVKFPSRETSLAITNLQIALMWLEERTRDREARGVEGKHKL